METARRAGAQKQLRARLRQQINWGRNALLAILAITLLNQFMLMIGVNYHFLFSSAVPYYLNWLGRELAAHGDVTAFKVIAVVLTMVMYVAYIACWLLSSQRREWLLAALGLYGIDTLLLVIFSLTLLENPASCLLEILTHLVGLWLLYVAVGAANRLSSLPRPQRPSRTRESGSEPAIN